MLDRYNNLPGLWPVPQSNDRYFIDVNGNIYNHNKEYIKPEVNSEGELVITTDIWGIQRQYKIAVFVALVFKASKVDYRLYNQLDVLYFDGNKKNIHASNLLWKYPKDGLRHLRYKDHAYIPGMSGYVISKEGELIRLRTNSVIEPFFEEYYAKFRLEPDVGRKYVIGRHRLICLAFMEYDISIMSLVVNHKNSIPGDDYLDNLELVTRTQNNTHAKENGLVTGQSGLNPILVKNVVTGEVLRFKGSTYCARYFNLNRSTVRYRLLAKGQPLYPGNLLFKYEEDPAEWRKVDPSEIDSKKLHNGEKVPIIGRNYFTNEIKKFESVVEAAEYTKVLTSTIHSLMKAIKRPRPINGWSFKLDIDDTPWPEYDKNLLEVFRRKPHGKIYPSYLENTETGEKHFFTDSTDICKFTNLSIPQLTRRLVQKKPLKKNFITKSITEIF